MIAPYQIGSDEIAYTTWFDNSVDELKLCLWPRKCHKSKKLLWLTFAYRSRRWHRSGDVHWDTEDLWFDKNEFLILKLQGY